MQGAQSVKCLCSAYPDIPILVFSGSEEPEIVRRCIEAGAFWFIGKSKSSDEIFTVVYSLVSDKSRVTSAEQYGSSERMRQLQSVASLTDRPVEVLKLMYQNILNKQIAFKLGCSENTVKVHCRGIFRVLGANNRKQAVDKALSLGMFD